MIFIATTLEQSSPVSNALCKENFSTNGMVAGQGGRTCREMGEVSPVEMGLLLNGVGLLNRGRWWVSALSLALVYFVNM